MNNKYPNRRSVRLRDYDYSQSGLYFITICAKDKVPLFGEIIDNEMILNQNGQIVRDCWLKTEQIRTNIVLGEYVIMPNHFHAIFAIDDSVCRGVLNTPANINIVPNDNPDMNTTSLQSPSQTVGAIVRGFKSSVTKCIGFPVWQRNYHEHIIRNKNSLQTISQYIIENPARWQDDCY